MFNDVEVRVLSRAPFCCRPKLRPSRFQTFLQRFFRHRPGKARVVGVWGCLPLLMFDSDRRILRRSVVQQSSFESPGPDGVTPVVCESDRWRFRCPKPLKIYGRSCLSALRKLRTQLSIARRRLVNDATLRERLRRFARLGGQKKRSAVYRLPMPHVDHQWGATAPEWRHIWNRTSSQWPSLFALRCPLPATTRTRR